MSEAIKTVLFCLRCGRQHVDGRAACGKPPWTCGDAHRCLYCKFEWTVLPRCVGVEREPNTEDVISTEKAISALPGGGTLISLYDAAYARNTAREYALHAAAWEFATFMRRATRDRLDSEERRRLEKLRIVLEEREGWPYK